jgi:hypothetical protein
LNATQALACFAAKWVLARGLLARLRVLVEPFAAGVLAPRARGGRLVLEAPDDGDGVAYRLVVVDEAHHVYGDDALRAAVEALVAPTTRRLLLSDVSQCRSRHVFYPAIAAEARLTAVWNSTTGLGGPDQTSEFSSSIKSKAIRLIFGRIDCSCRVLEAQPKRLRRNCRIRSH